MIKLPHQLDALPRLAFKPWLAQAIVVLLGIFIVLMLVFEHKQTNTLLGENQDLVEDVVVKTLVSNAMDFSATYPANKSELEENWLSLDANFEAVYEDTPIYPFRFRGLDNTSLSPLWGVYQNALEIGELDPVFVSKNTPETSARINALIKIKSALNAPSPGILRAAIDNYFIEVQHFQLSTLEELVSGLSFLQIDTSSRWNDLLIEQLLMQETLQAQSLYAYLFQHNSRLGAADARKAIELIQGILAQTQLDATWFSNNASALWQTSAVQAMHIRQSALQTSLPNASPDYVLINGEWLTVKPSAGFTLLLAFDLTQALLEVKAQLVLQGVLSADDEITVENTETQESAFNLSQIKLKITRLSWLQQAQRQRLYLGIKLAATLLLMLSLFMLTKWFAIRHQKRLEYIQLRERFINLVSHELKTPLASIRIMIETLQKRNERELSIKDYPQKIVAEVDHLWFMVDNLLSLNHIRSQALSLNIETHNLHSIIERVRHRYIENQRPVPTICNQVAPDIRLPFDALLFELVLSNLISNALKYNDKAQPIITFYFDDEKQTLFMRDNACGVMKENWRRVFDDFFRENNTLSRQGTGIGLSLCDQIMRLHAGQVFIAESTTNGTLWCIEFSTSKRK